MRNDSGAGNGTSNRYPQDGAASDRAGRACHGVLASWAGWESVARLIWLIGILPVLASLILEIIGSLRRGEVGLDIVAALSMSAAALWGETLAAAVVALMYAGGTVLESFAEGRARGEMHALLARVPHVATRYGVDNLEDVPLDSVLPDDRLLIRQGELVPVDGRVVTGLAVLDMSSLTGESMPVRVPAGDEVMSGTTNAGRPSTSASCVRPRTVPMPASFAWLKRRSAQRPPCRGWRIAGRLVFWPSRSPSHLPPGG